MEHFDCKCCKQVKPKSEFTVVKAHKNKRGVDSWCKTCKAKANRKYLHKNPDKNAKWKRENKVRSYGISVEYYQKMIEDQGNKCKICGQISERALDIDHCHTTGKVRGLLCSHCNKALGMFRDSYRYLEAAIKYLKENEGMQ